MDPVPADATAAARLAVRLGLTDDDTVRTLLADLGDRDAPAADFVRLLERKGVLSPFQGAKLLKGDADGYVLGGYRLLYRIASGSFGRVYRADNPSTGEVVAIKVLRKKWTDDARKVELFEREGRVGMTVRHPNIVSILAVSRDSATGQYYIVMEFVEGGTLRDILAIRKKMALDEALRIAEECASGLAYAWTKGMTHRDIKASNILLGTDKVAKLVDFGLADINPGAAAGAVGAGPKGKDEGGDAAMDRTIEYGGLERATNVKPGDIRSDIYFLGHVVYEIIAGEPLMPRTKDKHQAASRRRFEDAEATLARRGSELGLPDGVRRLLTTALAFEPARRYQSPAAFVEAIRSVRQELTDPGSAGGHHRAGGPLTIYVVEENAKLQDAFREKFKRMGFRVLISLDETQALRRYQQAPYHALLLDAGTAGRAGVDAFAQVLREAHKTKLDLCGLLVLNEDQVGWKREFENFPNAAVFVRPVTMKQLSTKLREAFPELSQAHEE